MAVLKSREENCDCDGAFWKLGSAVWMSLGRQVKRGKGVIRNGAGEKKKTKKKKKTKNEKIGSLPVDNEHIPNLPRTTRQSFCRLRETCRVLRREGKQNKNLKKKG